MREREGREMVGGVGGRAWGLGEEHRGREQWGKRGESGWEAWGEWKLSLIHI